MFRLRFITLHGTNAILVKQAPCFAIKRFPCSGTLNHGSQELANANAT